MKDSYLTYKKKRRLLYLGYLLIVMLILASFLVGSFFAVGLLWGISSGFFFLIYGAFLLITCILIGIGAFFVVRIISPFGKHDNYYKKLLNDNKYLKK